MSNCKNFGSLIVVCILLAGPAVVLAETLPVYELAPPHLKQAQAQATALLADLHGGTLPEKAQVTEEDDSSVHRVGTTEVVIRKVSGGIFLRDTAQLWNTKIQPELPTQAQARQIADRFVERHGVLPPSDAVVRVGFASYGKSGIVVENETGRQETVLDRHVNYGVRIAVERMGVTEELPVVGGGGDFKVIVGDRGAVIGYQGVWRRLARLVGEEEILSQEAAEAQFEQMVGGLNLVSVDSYLAYHSASSLEGQTHLAPVWVMRAEAEIGGHQVPLRQAIVAATGYGPEWSAQPVAPRTLNDQPKLSWQDGDEVPWLKDDGGSSECGAEWIGTSQGLPGSQGNAQGFVDGCTSNGWVVNFNWGDFACWESDFVANDDSWVDTVDFLFYTGHASGEGWTASAPNDGFVDHEELGGGAFDYDHYANDLEWLAIAACGPHQDDVLNGGGNVFARWRGILDGLHLHLGYAAVTFDNEEEGAKLSNKAMNQCKTVKTAWFETCIEVQPATNGWPAPNGPNIYGTALYPCGSGDDKAWGCGETLPDSPQPSCRSFHYTQC